MKNETRKALLRDVLVTLDEEWMQHKANLQRLFVQQRCKQAIEPRTNSAAGEVRE